MQEVTGESSKLSTPRRTLRVGRRTDDQVFLSASRRPLYDAAWSHISAAARQRMPEHWQELRIERLSSVLAAIRHQIDKAEGEELTELLLALLIAQSPQAAKAQELMKRRGIKFSNREDRLHELISFNDTFVDLILSFKEIPADIKDNIYYEIHRVCGITRTHPFSYKDYGAISKGLEREIALYQAAEQAGFEVRMTSRIADGLGVDMQISDKETGLQVNVDCKTESSYRFRLQALVRQGRVRQDDFIRADKEGFVHFTVGRGKEAIPVVLLRLDDQTVGGVEDFRFKNEDSVGAIVQVLIEKYGTRRKLIL